MTSYGGFIFYCVIYEIDSCELG